MNPRGAGVILVLVAASGCATPAFVPSQSPTRPFIEFDRVDAAPLKSGLAAKAPPSGDSAADPDAFLKSFRKDLIHRIQRRQVLDMATGPLLLLEGTLLRYDFGDRKPSSAKDMNEVAGYIDLEVVIKDEAGKVIGGGKASVSCPGRNPDFAMKGAEKRAIAAVGDYVRKLARRISGPDKPDPDDP